MAAKKIWSIGRDSNCDIVINSKNISRKQAEIIYHENVYYLINCSKHETSFVQRKGQKISVKKKRLTEEDLIYFADQGPYRVSELIDDELTVVQLEKMQGNTPTPQHRDNDISYLVEKKRCASCATILAKTQTKCHECGSVT